MLGLSLAEGRKKAHYMLSFWRRKLVHVNLQLLYDCTFRCQICDFWKPSYRDRPHLSVDQVRTIADKLREVGPQIVSIGGGEPLHHPDIEGVVRVLARDHFPAMICNGWLVNRELARRLFTAGIYEVSISVDYADPARHDLQRGKEGAFERAIEALRVLNENRVHTWQRVHMISVVMDDNLDEIEPLIRICRDMGITYLVTLYSDGRGTRPNRCESEEVSARLLDLKRRYPDFVVLRGYVARFSRAIAEGGIGPCVTGRNLCNIDSQGDVSLCIDRVDEPVGNIFTDEMLTLEKRLLEAHSTNTCKGCWTSCRGNIEVLMDSDRVMANLRDYHQMTRSMPLVAAATEEVAP